MPLFTSLHEWRFNPATGVIDLRLKASDGQTYDASFARELVPTLLIHLHRLLSSTTDDFPEGMKQLVEAYIPKSLSMIVLPNGQPAIEFVTVADMRVPIPVSAEVATAIRAALAEANHLLQAPQPDATKH